MQGEPGPVSFTGNLLTRMGSVFNSLTGIRNRNSAGVGRFINRAFQQGITKSKIFNSNYYQVIIEHV